MHVAEFVMKSVTMLIVTKLLHCAVIQSSFIPADQPVWRAETLVTAALLQALKSVTSIPIGCTESRDHWRKPHRMNGEVKRERANDSSGGRFFGMGSKSERHSSRLLADRRLLRA